MSGHNGAPNQNCQYPPEETPADTDCNLSPYEAQLKKEIVLPVDEIQGDPILGFNKARNLQVILDITDSSSDGIIAVKDWLSRTVLPRVTSLADVLHHRNSFAGRFEDFSGDAFVNISFSYSALKKFLKYTKYELSLNEFDQTSAFVIGATERATLLGDSISTWQFGGDHNNDILINIASDFEIKIDEMKQVLFAGTCHLLKVAMEVPSFRGARNNDVLYGHEQFGFQDGLSQPEVRGTYNKEAGADPEFVVRRRIEPSDDRFPDYSRPGFRLLDTGHFLLGYLNQITDTNDPGMQNPDPDRYRTLEEKYPSWCYNASFTIFRKLEQDVHAFWNQAITTAHELDKENDLGLNEMQLRDLAGAVAAKMIGRWWDGTPLIFKGPLTHQYYPPSPNDCQDDSSRKEFIAKKRALVNLDGLKNGFQFVNPEAPWPVRVGHQKEVLVKPPGLEMYPSDPQGLACPFAAHIRKVNPRDEFTDIGSDIQTLRHRIIRRGNNYGRRVADVFEPVNDGEERGLALIMYSASIEDQFEFLQRHWANSSTRPKSGGDDMIIGQPATQDKTISFTVDVQGKSIASSITTPERFVTARGMGYFILLPKSSILNVVCAIPEKEEQFVYLPPALQFDFKQAFSYNLWDWTVRALFWQSIWGSANTTNVTAQITLPAFDGMDAAGIAYRLPNVHELATQSYTDLSKRSYLQFRSTEDLTKMADMLDIEAVVATIAWQAFPKRLLNLYGNSNVNPYEVVEQPGWPSKDVTYRNYSPQPLARQMDEYCEWFTHRNSSGLITRIDITCESPEYWTFLFTNEPDTALELYREYINAMIEITELQNPDGSYNMYNKWNTTHGAMHLNCPPNSLSAEIFIAAEASTYWGCCSKNRLDPGEDTSGKPCEPYTTGSDLIRCAEYGLPTRASDPTIGANVNELIRGGNIVSITQPVGLYIEDLDTTGWQDPSGKTFTTEKIKELVRYERGSPGMHLRISIEVPDSWGYVLGQCRIGGDSLQWAGQLIDSSATVFLRGTAVPGATFLSESPSENAIVPCKALWAYTSEKLIGPLPRNEPLFSRPEFPVEGVGNAQRKADLKHF